MPSKKSILIIEDDLKTLELLEKVISGSGYETSTARDYVVAKKQIINHNPHLILLDFDLPGKKAKDVLAFIKENAQYSHIPTFVMTAKPSKEFILFMAENGIDHIISKPVQSPKLLIKIKKTLKEFELPQITDLQEKVTIQTIGDIIKINEVELLLQSSSKLPAHTKLNINSPFLDSFNLSTCQYEVLDDSKVANPGIYRTRVSIKGMTEESTRKIRQIKVIKR